MTDGHEREAVTESSSNIVIVFEKHRRPPIAANF